VKHALFSIFLQPQRINFARIFQTHLEIKSMTSDEKYILEGIVLEEQTRVTNHLSGALDSLAHRDHATARANAFVSASIHGATYALREWVGPQEAAALLRKFADAIDVQAAKH